MAEKKKAPASPATEPSRAIAIVDADGVLVGRLDNPSDAEWDKARPECRFPNGFDNALHRYRLLMWRPDRWRFDPITHAKDAAAENLEGSPKILAPLARAVLAFAGGENPSIADLNKIGAFLKTFDAKGN